MWKKQEMEQIQNEPSQPRPPISPGKPGPWLVDTWAQANHNFDNLKENQEEGTEQQNEISDASPTSPQLPHISSTDLP